MEALAILDSLPFDRSPAVRKFAELLEPRDRQELEQLAAGSHQLTIKHFGKVMRLFAPLYVSNECINICKYCGFSRDNPILRVTLSLEEVEEEARHLAQEGFRNILIVAGEHPKFVSNGYLADCVRRISPFIPSISLEVGPMEAEEYAPIVAAGAEGLVVYQETYHRETYRELHISGPKTDFDWRLACPERAYEAGFRRLGIGALYGLHTDWREEAIATAAHIDHLLRRCWKAQITVSLPRIRPAAGGFKPRAQMSDRDLVQLVCAFRLTFPEVGIVLSTRETPGLRDGLMPLGITMMSAGSHTEPGGYTGQGSESLHLTVRGRHVEPELETRDGAIATGQFSIADERSACEIAGRLRERGIEPVWKDWDQALAGEAR